MASMISPVTHIGQNNILLTNSTKNISESTENNNLYTEQIKITNVWNYPVFNIGFNKDNTFEISNGGNYLNPYYTGNNSLTVNITNSNGKIIYNQNFAGGSYPYEEVNQALGNKKFNYGDIINIISRSNAHLEVDGVESRKEINYIITRNGLKKLNNDSVSNLGAYYNGNNTVVTGETTPNTLVTLWVGNKSYSTISGSSGAFKVTLPSSIMPGTNIVVAPHNEVSESIEVTPNPNVYKILNNVITINNVWNENIGALKFNPITSEIEFIKGWTMVNPYLAKNKDAFSISLYKNNAELIKSIQVNGDEYPEQNLYNTLNNLKYSYGDYIKIKYNSSSKISISNFNNQKNYEINKTIVLKITKDGLLEVNQPSISVSGNKLTINSYANARVTIKINGKDYDYKTNSKGQFIFKVPSDITVGTPITVTVIKGNMKTLPVTVYSAYSNSLKEFSYNMFRYASFSPSSKVALKGDDMTLTSYEPIPLQFSGKAKVLIDIKGDIKEKAAIYFNNGVKRQYLTTVNVNTPTVVNVPESGALIVDTGNVDYDGNQASKFNFKVNVKVQSGYYRSIPVFDNRGFVKIDSEATSNEATFNKEIFSPSNIDHGAIIIGDHVRIYIPNVGESLPTTFNAQNTVNWYNEAFISDNELNGLSQNATSQLDKFHTNFFYVTTYTSDNGDGWWTGSGGTSAIPGMFKIGLTTPGWIMFHEVGHIFDPIWADSYLHCEVYSNMYTQETQLRIQGKTSWLYNGLNPKDVDKNIGPIFEGYLNGDFPTNYLQQFSEGLYYFTLLKQYFPDYMAKTDDLYRSEWYNNTLPYKGIDFLAYAMAKIYHTNIIPSLEMWGYKIENQNLIKYVIDNSTNTTNLVPKEDYFNKYRNMSVPVTILTPQLVNNSYIIKGLVNPNSKVIVQYDGKDYTTTCNSAGKFTISFPKGESSIAKIYAETPEKTKGYVSVLSLSKAFIENNKSFSVVSNNGAGGTLAVLSMTPEGTINFVSTGGNPDWEAKGNQYFMNMKVSNPEGKVIFKEDIYQHSNFNEAKEFLQQKKLPIGTIITFDAPTSNTEIAVNYSEMNKNKGNLKPTIADDLQEWNIVVTKYGLEYVQKPTLDITTNTKTLDLNAISGSQVELTIGNKTYKENVGADGKVSMKLPENLQVGEKVIYKDSIGSRTLINETTQIYGVNSTLTINNVWKQPLGAIKFNYENYKIQVQGGWSEVNPYLSGEAFKLILENKDGQVIKSFTANGGVYIGSDLTNTFNNVDFKVGDKFIIEYKASSQLSINKIMTPQGISQYDIKKPTTIYITKDGLSLIKPKENEINESELKKDIAKGQSVINSGDYTPDSVKALENDIKDGKALLSNPKATQSEVNNDANAINKAIEGLVKKANTEALEKAIKEGTTDVNSKKYTTQSVESLEKAIEEGKTLLNNPNATQEEVNNQVDVINNAIKGLKENKPAKKVEKVNESELKNDIAKGQSAINSGDYTPNSVNVLENAINAGKSDLTNPNLSESEVNNDIKAINTAIGALKTNETGLKGDIAKAEAQIGSEKYTPDSVKIVQQALENGRQVLSNSNVTPEEVHNAENRINNSLKSLVDRANASELKKLVGVAEKAINSGKYTKQSVQSLVNEVSRAKVLLENLNATQNEINNETSALENAINGLQVKPTSSEPNGEKTKVSPVQNPTSNVDTSKLKNAIKLGESYINNNKYTPNSIENLENVINSAKELLSNKNITQNEVNKEVEAINNAINGLKDNKVKESNTVSKDKKESDTNTGNKENNKVNNDKKVSNVNNEDNKKNPVKVVQPKKIINNDNPSTKKVSVNKSEIKKLIEQGENDINSGIYTPDSVKSLQNEINAGKKLLDNSNGTKAEINNVINSINKAINGLKVNKTGLKNDIAKAKSEIRNKKYSESSIKNVEKAVSEGENILNNPNSTPSEVHNAQENIQKAINQLPHTGLSDSLKVDSGTLGIFGTMAALLSALFIFRKKK